MEPDLVKYSTRLEPQLQIESNLAPGFRHRLNDATQAVYANIHGRNKTTGGIYVKKAN